MANAPKTQRFGVIGCGSIAQRAVLPALQTEDCAQLVVVGSRSIEKARNIATQFGCEACHGYEDVIGRDDIDAVYIATPIGLHAEWAVAAAEAGKHVLCEKSLATNFGEARRILDACAAHDVALLEGFMYQFHPQHAAAREAVAQGLIGEPVQFQAWFGFPPLPEENIRYQSELGGGALLDAGAYTVHAARNFFGREPTHTFSSLDNGGRPVDIHGAALLDFGRGQTAQLSFGFNNMYRNCYQVWGTEGILTLPRAFSIPPTFAPTMIVERQGSRDERPLSSSNQFVGEIQAFCSKLQSDEMRRLWREDAFHQSRVLEALKAPAGN
jgi:predicted dehydrogenase